VNDIGIRRQLDRAQRMDSRLRVLARRRQRLGDVDDRRMPVGRDRERAPIGGDRGVECAVAVMDVAHVVPGGHVIRPQLDHAGEDLLGPFPEVQRDEHDAQVVECIGHIGSDRQRTLDQGLAFPGAASPERDHPGHVQRRGVIRSFGNDLAEQTVGIGDPAGVEQLVRRHERLP